MVVDAPLKRSCDLNKLALLLLRRNAVILPLYSSIRSLFWGLINKLCLSAYYCYSAATSIRILDFNEVRAWLANYVFFYSTGVLLNPSSLTAFFFMGVLIGSLSFYLFFTLWLFLVEKMLVITLQGLCMWLIELTLLTGYKMCLLERFLTGVLLKFMQVADD